ncbi:hypothetical protein [Flavobacterium sp.]|nr:hypothetical protein [Flavobacterium sp.]HLP65792.1 hypothetical protein [Flavobacterium sp.]
MKKLIVLLLIASFVASCAPKRARCYGKRCVDHSKIENSHSNKRNS